MKIDFFNTCNGMDPRAINHGVYMIELLEKEESVCLYIGESVYFAAYVFYILQIYIPERSKNRKALVATALETYNFTHQVDIFFFV